MKQALTHGTFDLLHPGHIAFLERCHSYGDSLTVGLSSDEMATLRKGNDRPILSFSERKTVLEALRSVDKVVEVPFITADFLENLMLFVIDWRPDVFVTTYEQCETYRSKLLKEKISLEIIPESRLCSTTELIQRIRRSHHASS